MDQLSYICIRLNSKTMRLSYSNAAQIEMMNAISCIDTEEELYELKLLLSNFFAAKAQKEIDKLWDNGTLNQEKLDEIRKEHLRTPYRQ